MDGTELLIGRPHGGIRIICKKEFIKQVNTISGRICDVKSIHEDNDMYMYATYMPCDIHSLNNYLKFNNI